MRTILVLNAKGGCGKTTIATNIAGYYACHEKTVALVDFDPQGSSIDWLRARSTHLPAIHSVAAFELGYRIPKNTDVVVIDAPAKSHGEELTKLVRLAQSIVIPIVPSPLDLRAAQRFFNELRNLRTVIKTNVKLATIANRVRERTLVANHLEDYLDELRLPSGRRFPFLTMLRASSNYLRAAERGLSIFEFAPLETAPDREYWAPLIRWLNSPRSLP